MLAVDFVAVLIVVAGFVVFWFANEFLKAERAAREKVQEALSAATEQFKTAGAAATAAAAKESGDKGLGTTAQVHAANLNAPAEFVKGLAEFAKAIGSLTRPIQAILIAVILFFVAGVVVVSGNAITANQASPSPSATASPTR